MKRLFICTAVLFLCISFFAENTSSLPRYKGFAIGEDAFGQFPIGYYSKFANANIGLSLAGEYTFPLNLPKNMDLGGGLRAEYGHVFPKSDVNLKSDEEIRAFANIWLRIPFSLFNQYFAFQPEVGAGLSTFITKYQFNGTEKSGTYLSPLISIAPSVRWIPMVLQNLEVELAPLFTIVPEKDKTTNMLGIRLGAIWHFEMKNKAVVDEISAEEKRKAKEAKKAEEAEKTRLAEKARLAEEAEKARLAAEEAEKARQAEEDAKRVEEAEKARIAAEEEEKSRLAAAEAALLAAEETVASQSTEEEESQPVIEEDETDEYTQTSVRLGLKNILFFSKNGAVFTGLSRREIAQNERTINQAVALIKEHPGCHVLIEGYANNISGTEKEDRTACMPLSLWRAEYIKKELIKRGIKAEQIETVGRGGSNPLAGRKDRNNWWKNRRVEFVITY